MAKHIEFRHGGRLHFFTLATYKRLPILVDNKDAALEGWRAVSDETGMELICWAILPNHLHVIIDTNFNSMSKLSHAFKLASAKLFHVERVSHRKTLWESSGWDQPLTSKEDLERHIDFVHYNPVKHGLASSPWEYQHSSFREFVKHGYYFKDWTIDSDRRQSLRELDDTDV